jgi:hypothetical protein
MKGKTIIAAALCYLIFAWHGLAAQEFTAPPPPPDRESSILPPPYDETKTPQAEGKTTAGTSRIGVLKDALTPKRTGRTTEADQQQAGGKAEADQRQAGRKAEADQQQAGEKAEASGGAKGINFFWGGMFGVSPLFYNFDDGILWGSSRESMVTFDGALYLGWSFSSFSFQLEGLLTGDNVKLGYYDTTKLSYYDTQLSGISLLVPLIFKWSFNIGRFAIQPLAGPYLNFALGSLKASSGGRDPYANPLLGMMFGSALGWNFRKGMLFLDTRFAMDLGNTVVSSGKIWKKRALMVSVGYQFN